MSTESAEAASRAPAIDLSQAGPSEEHWAAVSARLADFTWPSTARVIVVSPHPDDETLGAGGLIATAVDRGLSVTVVSVTDGEAAFAHPDLAAVRRAELAAALARLAPGVAIAHRRLGLPDGHVESSTSVLARELVSTFEPGDLVVCPLPDDGHPDHAATARATVAAASLAGAGAVRCFPIWAWHCHDPATTMLRHAGRLDLAASALERKRAAIGCFASQTSGPDPIVPPAMIRRLSRSFEVFIDPRSAP